MEGERGRKSEDEVRDVGGNLESGAKKSGRVRVAELDCEVLNRRPDGWIGGSADGENVEVALILNATNSLRRCVSVRP